MVIWIRSKIYIMFTIRGKGLHVCEVLVSESVVVSEIFASKGRSEKWNNNKNNNNNKKDSTEIKKSNKRFERIRNPIMNVKNRSNGINGSPKAFLALNLSLQSKNSSFTFAK